jgi:hypothetical protein
MVLVRNGSQADSKFRVGDRVEVRSQAEILATLDERAELDALPFMPEMLRFCGKRLTVTKVAHKVCDTISKGGMRRMDRAVHLTAARCDGSAHGGCQNACLLYWKDDWLKSADDTSDDSETQTDPEPNIIVPLLHAATRKEPDPDGAERFSCQATELNRATPNLLPLREMRQYVTDLRSGNANLFWILRAFSVALFNRLQNRSSRLLPPRLRFRAGLPWQFLAGRAVGRTPAAELNLRQGERVRIKSKEDILDTLNSDQLNRGMGFDAEMARFCGREATVERRVDHVINEKTGRMAHLKTPAVVLEGFICEGAYNANCPRGWTCFFREIWLERI